jgi:hypothetical protein
MTSNKKQAIPAAIPVEEIAAQMNITPDKLRLAIGLAAAPVCTVDLGDGLHVKVELANVGDDGDFDYHAWTKLDRLHRLATRESRRILLAAPPASKQRRSLLAAPSPAFLPVEHVPQCWPAEALGNLADRRCVIRVSSDPDCWVRVVSVEAELVDGGVRPLTK